MPSGNGGAKTEGRDLVITQDKEKFINPSLQAELALKKESII